MSFRHRNNFVLLTNPDLQLVSSVKEQKSKAIKKCVTDIYSVLNKYLWFHWIGFEDIIDCSGHNFCKTFISFLFAIVSEANLVFLVYMLFQMINSSQNNMKEYLAAVVPMLFHSMIRFSFYGSRKKLKKNMHRVGEIYAKVGKNGSKVKKFKSKLIILLCLNDLFSYVDMIYYFYSDYENLLNRLRHVEIPLSYALPAYYMSQIIHNCGYVHPAATAYFCSACFVLKESLKALDKKLNRSDVEEELEILSKVYCEISDIVLQINRFFHFHMLSTFAFILSRVFEQAYNAIFSEEDHNALLRAIHVIVLFSLFVCICLFGSCVLSAASTIKSTVHNLTLKLPQQRCAHLLYTMKEDIDGFTVLSSTVINSNLILSTIGNLITYGILVATFSTSKSTADGK